MQLHYNPGLQEIRLIGANVAWLGRNVRGATLGHDWDSTGRTFTGPENLSAGKVLLLKICHHKSTQYQLKLGNKQSFIADSN